MTITEPKFSSLESLLMAYELDQVYIENVYYSSNVQDNHFTITFTGFYGVELYTHDCCADDFQLIRENTLFKFIKE